MKNTIIALRSLAISLCYFVKIVYQNFTSISFVSIPFQIVFEGFKKFRDENSRQQMFTHAKENRIVPMEERTHYIDGLMPKTIYTFNISAKFMDGNWGPEYSMRVETSVDG